MEFAWLNQEFPSCESPNRIITNSLTLGLHGSWNHISLTHTSDAVNIYLNGIQIYTRFYTGRNSDIINSSQPVRIGAYQLENGNISNYFNGKMDEIRIWNRALTESEIEQNYNTSITGNEIDGFGTGVLI